MRGVRKRSKERLTEKRTAEVNKFDFKQYSAKPEVHEPVTCLADLPREYQRALLSIGVVSDEKQRAGSFMQLDQSVIYAQSKQKGLEVYNSGDALKKYPWLKDYWWKVVNPEADEYTTRAKETQPRGYFIRALQGVKTSFPLQSCLFIGKDDMEQTVHNIIIAEAGSELNIITGCAVAPTVTSGMHIGVSEFYVKPGAKIIFTMIHNWAENVHVRPRSGCRVEKNGVFISNYVVLRPVKNLQMYPTAWCTGENAIARFSTICYGKGNSQIDLGSRVYLQAPNTRSEIVSRTIAADRSNIVVRGHIIGEVPKTKAHLECQGMLLSDTARMIAIPQLEAKIENTDLSHEAAIGKIAQEKVEYLMARGLSEETAKSVLIRGFLKIDLPGLPISLKTEIDRTIQQATSGL